MKRIFCLIATLLVTSQVWAVSSYTSCNNGTIDTVGDGLFTADFYEDGLSLQIYEGGLEFDAEEVTWQGNTLAILDLKKTYYVEGTEESVVVNAIITMGFLNRSANIAYSLNNGPFRSLELSCNEVPVVETKN